MHYMRTSSLPWLVCCPHFYTFCTIVCPLCSSWNEFLSELGQRPSNLWSSFELCYLMVKWSRVWTWTNGLFHLLKNTYFCMVFASRIAVNFTQLILEQCCKMITRTGITFQEPFMFNGTLYTEKINRPRSSPLYIPLRLQGWLMWQLALGWIIHRAWTHRLCDCNYNPLWLELKPPGSLLRGSKSLIEHLCTSASRKQEKKTARRASYQVQPWAEKVFNKVSMNKYHLSFSPFSHHQESEILLNMCYLTQHLISWKLIQPSLQLKQVSVMYPFKTRQNNIFVSEWETEQGLRDPVIRMLCQLNIKAVI